jgi:hypothetical protein
VKGEFERIMGCSPVVYYTKNKGFAFKTIIRNTILTHFILNLMHSIRRLIVTNPKKNEELTNFFVAKLLTGDGTLDVDKRKVPRVAFKIVDKCSAYLRDYEEIFTKLGFAWSWIDPKYRSLKISCSFQNLLYLYRVKAFKNTLNWYKLLVVIGLCLRGRRLRTKLRFLDLMGKTFTSLDVRDSYDICLRSANDWLSNMRREGYIERVCNKAPYRYRLTREARRLARTLQEWKRDLSQLIKHKKIDDLSRLLQELKVKSAQPKRALNL